MHSRRPKYLAGQQPVFRAQLAVIDEDMRNLRGILGPQLAWQFAVNFQSFRFAFKASRETWSTLEKYLTPIQEVLVPFAAEDYDPKDLPSDMAVPFIFCRRECECSDPHSCNRSMRAEEFVARHYPYAVLITPISGYFHQNFDLLRAPQRVILDSRGLRAFVEIWRRWKGIGQTLTTLLNVWIERNVEHMFDRANGDERLLGANAPQGNIMPLMYS